MPSVFKALASITVWGLFIFGILALLGGFGRILSASMGVSASPELSTMTDYFGLGIVIRDLSVFCMNLMHTME